MSSIDILQDVHDKRQMPTVRKARLFLCHIIAIVCLGYFGIMLIMSISMPSFESLDEQLRNVGKAPRKTIDIDELRFWNRFTVAMGYVFALAGGMISYFICRKLKLTVFLSISILLYSFIIFYIAQQIPYTGLLFPATYLLRYLGLNYGVLVNLVYLLAIALFLFFSKRVKNWYIKAVVE